MFFLVYRVLSNCLSPVHSSFSLSDINKSPKSSNTAEVQGLSQFCLLAKRAGPGFYKSIQITSITTVSQEVTLAPNSQEQHSQYGQLKMRRVGLKRGGMDFQNPNHPYLYRKKCQVGSALNSLFQVTWPTTESTLIRAK